jgi:hypothetical protein
MHAPTLIALGCLLYAHGGRGGSDHTASALVMLSEKSFDELSYDPGRAGGSGWSIGEKDKRRPYQYDPRHFCQLMRHFRLV